MSYCTLKCIRKSKKCECKSPPYVYSCNTESKALEHSTVKIVKGVYHEKDNFKCCSPYKMSVRTRNKSYLQATLDDHILNMARNGRDKDVSFINPDTFEKSDLEEKLSTLMLSLNSLHAKVDGYYEDMNKEPDGIVATQTGMKKDLGEVLGEADALRFEITILKGITHKQDRQISSLVDKVNDLTARSMSDNITISGLPQATPEENCKQVVLSFLKDKVGIEVPEADLLVVHRIGLKEQEEGKTQLMVVRCHPPTKQLILDKAKNLKGKKNQQGKPYYINQQLPEHVLAERKELSHGISKVKDDNKKKPQGQKLKYEVKNKKLYINDNPVTKAVERPTVGELFVESNEQDRMDKIKLHFSDAYEEKGSVFTAIAVKVSNLAEVKRAFRKIRQIHPAADHIPMAYDCQKKQSCLDDGEYSAGLCIQKVLESQNVVNRAVFVPRIFGGRKLGARRFEIIEEAVKQAIIKGMAVLRLLRGFLGWDEFRRGLQMYISKYKFKNAKMSELWSTFKEAVGGEHDVGLIMDTWTRQMGFPVVTVKHKRGNKYELIQERFLLNPEDKKRLTASKSRFKYKWRIPFSYQLEDSDEVHTKWMIMESADITIAAGKWIIGNVDYMGFYRTNYDVSMWKKLISQLKTDHTVFSAANRAGLISDAFNLARANKLNYEIALNLSSYLSNEDDFVPWRAFLDSIDFIKGMLSTSNAYGKLLKYIRDLVAPQYRRVGTSDQGDLLDRNLRQAVLEAATSVSVPDAVEWARNMFDSWMKYGSRIPPDYAVVVYSVGIAQGSEKEWNHVWEKSKTTKVASEAEIMMHALAFSQEPWLLWRYARWSMDSSKIRMQDVRNLFRYFASTPLGRSVALQFLLTNWIEINDRFGMDAFLLRDIIYATTSLINTEYEYKQLRRLYEEYPPAGVARKAAENSLALIGSNKEWMKSNQNTIENWLTTHVPDDDVEKKTA